MPTSRSSRAFVAAAMLGLAGCAVEREAHLYPINEAANATGLIEGKTIGHGQGHGTIEGTMPDGEHLQGEFSIVFGGSVGFGNILATANSAAGSVTASGFSTSVAISDSGQGSAVLSGDRGTSIQCEFLNNNLTGHGYGACKSSKGGLYRMVY